MTDRRAADTMNLPEKRENREVHTMMTIETAKKFEEALADKEYAAELLKLDPKEAKASLAAKGYEFSDEDLMEMAEAIQKALTQAKDGELSENDLEAVAGGGHIGSYVAGVAVGVAVGVGAFAVGIAGCCW